jgi:hypothetical protein
VQGGDRAFYGVALTSELLPNGLLGKAIYRIFEPGKLCQHREFDPLPDLAFGDAPTR